jgi:hypothetical protein
MRLLTCVRSSQVPVRRSAHTVFWIELRSVVCFLAENTGFEADRDKILSMRMEFLLYRLPSLLVQSVVITVVFNDDGGRGDPW